MKNKVYLAPMANVSDNPSFLFMCKKYGCEVLVLPMVFLESLSVNPKFVEEKLETLFNNSRGTRFNPLIIQIIGQDIENLEKGMDFLSSFDLQGINYNFGCPSHKIAKLTLGARMLQFPERRDKMIDAILKHTPFPFSIKIRLMGGKEPNVKDTAAFCKSLEGKDIEWIAIHGRTIQQGYSGKADWDAIKHIKDAINIPVIGNGDIANSSQGLKLISRGFCDAFMIGRAAMKDPRVFLKEPVKDEQENQFERMVVLFNDYLSFLEENDQVQAKRYLSLHEQKRWLIYFSKGIRGGKVFRDRLMKVKDINEFPEFLEDYLKNLH
ncbi:MAG: tRNA dihydrouridine synthase [Candidatus Hodarchaeota archaeon]